jgi:hypothetical protein
MRSAHRYLKYFMIGFSFLSVGVFAQETTAPVGADNKPEVQAPAVTAKTESTKSQSEKKMVQDATITLQTTITGNQEQPRVLYILPWQSPVAAEVDFESLDNEQKAVFGHVEREELRRELEASDEVK